MVNTRATIFQPNNGNGKGPLQEQQANFIHNREHDNDGMPSSPENQELAHAWCEEVKLSVVFGHYLTRILTQRREKKKIQSLLAKI